MAQPEGVLEDVLVKVGKFIIPVYFFVIKMKEDTQVPLLLGRPFLETGVALIDVKKDELTLRVRDEAVQFNLDKSLTQLDVDAENCMAVDNIYPFSFELKSNCNLQHSINENEMNFQYLKSVDYELLHSRFQNTKTVWSLKEKSTENSCGREKKVTEQETNVEGLILKELPSHLKYAFLELEGAKPVIISAALNKNEEQQQIFLYICELNMQERVSINECDIGTPDIYRFPQVEGLSTTLPDLGCHTKKVIKHTSGSKSYAQIRHEHVENLLLIKFACISIVHKK